MYLSFLQFYFVLTEFYFVLTDFLWNAFLQFYFVLTGFSENCRWRKSGNRNFLQEQRVHLSKTRDLSFEMLLNIIWGHINRMSRPLYRPLIRNIKGTVQMPHYITNATLLCMFCLKVCIFTCQHLELSWSMYFIFMKYMTNVCPIKQFYIP